MIGLVLDWYWGILGWIDVEFWEIIVFSLNLENMIIIYMGFLLLEFMVVDFYDGLVNIM